MVTHLKGSVNMKEQLKKQFRKEFDKYIIPLFKEQCCSRCGSKEKLHLHHETQFSQIFEKGWKMFDIDNNTAQENIDMFSSWMLGEQLKTNMITLCEECHLHEHGKQHIHEKQINIKFNEKLFVAFLCKAMKTDKFLLSYTDMMHLLGHEVHTRRHKERINYLTQGNKKYMYDDYVNMLSDVDFNVFIHIDELIQLYNNYPKQFVYILEIYYILQTTGSKNLCQLIASCEFTNRTYYNHNLEDILKQCNIFVITEYVNERNAMEKIFTIKPE